MDYIREWVLRIAGIIILISACDMIMLEGEMKKYIKPVLGIILIITVVRPVFGDVSERFDFLNDYSPAFEGKLLADAKDRQQEDIKRIYEKRLSQEVQKLLLDQYGIKVGIRVTAKEKTSDFGDIISIEVILANETDMKINQEELRAYIEKNLGVGKDKIVFIS